MEQEKKQVLTTKERNKKNWGVWGLALVMAGWWLLAACGLSPKDACKRTMELTCQKLHECTKEEDKGEMFKELWGADVAECKTKVEQSRTYEKGPIKITISGANCDSKTAENACNNDTKKVYHPEKVEPCIQAWEAAKCEDILNTNGMKQPTVCDEVCQTS